MDIIQYDYEGMNIDEIAKLPLDGEDLLYEADRLLNQVYRLLVVSTNKFIKDGKREIANKIGSLSTTVIQAATFVTDIQDYIDEQKGE